MKLAAITKTWKFQLQSESLLSLAAKASDLGAQHIELRQGHLGDCETGEGAQWRPVLSQFYTMYEANKQTSFNLAIELPCLTQLIDPKDAFFQSALEGARVVNPPAPHLRLVDPNASIKRSLLSRLIQRLRTTPKIRPNAMDWQTIADIPKAAFGLVDLTQEAARQGVSLSIENSFTPIPSLDLLIQAVQDSLEDAHKPLLGHCADVSNQRDRFPDRRAVEDLSKLPVERVHMVHFKQTRDGKSLPAIAEGDIDNASILVHLRDIGYKGPLVVETPPHADAMTCLAQSFSYMSGCLA